MTKHFDRIVLHAVFLQPEGAHLGDYGRLLKDGDLRVRKGNEKKERNLYACFSSLSSFNCSKLAINIIQNTDWCWGQHCTTGRPLVSVHDTLTLLSDLDCLANPHCSLVWLTDDDLGLVPVDDVIFLVDVIRDCSFVLFWLWLFLGTSAVTDHVNQENYVINWNEAKIIARESDKSIKWIREAVKTTRWISQGSQDRRFFPRHAVDIPMVCLAHWVSCCVILSIVYCCVVSRMLFLFDKVLLICKARVSCWLEYFMPCLFIMNLFRQLLSAWRLVLLANSCSACCMYFSCGWVACNYALLQWLIPRVL